MSVFIQIYLLFGLITACRAGHAWVERIERSGLPMHRTAFVLCILLNLVLWPISFIYSKDS